MNDVITAFLGGLLIGTGIIGYLYSIGRIAGISGLISQTMYIQNMFKRPAIWFLLGIVVTPFIYKLFHAPQIELTHNPLILILSGLLVGFGTRLGSGCTSGHGVCGMSRLSKRSFLATITFMLAGFFTVYVIRHLIGFKV